MLRTLRTPLLRVRPATIPATFRRSLAVAATETFKDPSASLPPKQSSAAFSFLENEPARPNIVTEIPGPKVQAAKKAMGKLQDVS
jgi:hypothetical protein